MSKSPETRQNPYLLDKISESMGRFQTVEGLLAYIGQSENEIAGRLTESDQAKRTAIIDRISKSKNTQHVLRIYGFDQIKTACNRSEVIKNLHAFLVKMHYEAGGPPVKGKRISVEMRLLLLLAKSLDCELVGKDGELVPQFGVSSNHIGIIVYRLRRQLGISTREECGYVIPWSRDQERHLLRTFFIAHHPDINNRYVTDKIRQLLACGTGGHSSVEDEFGIHHNTFERIKDSQDEQIASVEERLLIKDLGEFNRLKSLADEGNEWAQMLIKYIQGARGHDLNHPVIEGRSSKALSHIFSVVEAAYCDPELGMEAIKSQDLVHVANTIVDRLSEQEQGDLYLARQNAFPCVEKSARTRRSAENFALWRYRAMSCDVEEFLRREWLKQADMPPLCKCVDQFVTQHPNKFLSEKDVRLFRDFVTIRGKLPADFLTNKELSNKFLIAWEYFRREGIVLTDDQIDRLVGNTNDKFEKDERLKTITKSAYHRSYTIVGLCVRRKHDKHHPGGDEMRKFLTQQSTMPYMAVHNLIRFQKEGLVALIPIFRGEVGELEDGEDNA